MGRVGFAGAGARGFGDGLRRRRGSLFWESCNAPLLFFRFFVEY
jgi:hypothetical protein